ncbi:MAG TPA: DUF1961 family protein [Oceanipulchritudo sp.]|nr:DUF1961 family protein [Oceanipulchritudo sp.]
MKHSTLLVLVVSCLLWILAGCQNAPDSQSGPNVVFLDNFESWYIGEPLAEKPDSQIAGYRRFSDFNYMTTVVPDRYGVFGKGPENKMLRIGRTPMDPGGDEPIDFSIADLPVGQVMTVSFLFFTDGSGDGEMRLRLRGDDSSKVQDIRITDDGAVNDQGNLRQRTYLGDGNKDGDRSGTVGRPMRLTLIFNEENEAITYKDPTGAPKRLGSRKVDIWVDGQLRIDGYANPDVVTSNINRIMFRFQPDEVPVFYIDDLVIIDGAVAPTMQTSGGQSKRTDERVSFENSLDADWEEVFRDEGTGNWHDSWILDGEIGTVTNSDKGMRLTAGPERFNDAHHMVLWTRQSFYGDLKIEYEYTRLDDITDFVNILYIQATGSGEESFAEDIMEWKEMRKVPAMRMYFENMHLYHISYAAHPNNEETQSYIRARRYMPHKNGLKGTELQPDYYPEGLFEKGVPHQITVIKHDRDLLMRVENQDQTAYFHFRNPDLPVIRQGRIGLRHMNTRSALYRNFLVSEIE